MTQWMRILPGVTSMQVTWVNMTIAFLLYVPPPIPPDVQLLPHLEPNGRGSPTPSKPTNKIIRALFRIIPRETKRKACGKEGSKRKRAQSLGRDACSSECFLDFEIESAFTLALSYGESCCCGERAMVGKWCTSSRVRLDHCPTDAAAATSIDR